MHSLHRLQNDLGTKTLFVVLSVLALLSLAAIFASPARADLAGGLIDQVSGVVDTTTSTTADDGTTVADDGTTVADDGTTVADDGTTVADDGTTVADDGTTVADDGTTVADDGTAVTDDGTTVEDNGAPTVEEGPPTSLQQGVADVLVVDEAVELLEDVPPVVDDAIEVAVEAPPVVEDVLDVVEAGPPVVEDLLTVVGVAPVVEVVEDAPPLGEIVDEIRPVVADIVMMASPQVVEMIRVLPLFVPSAVADPGPIEGPTDSAIPTISSTREVVLPSQTLNDGSQRSSGLFTKELVAEMTLFHLADLTDGSAAGGSSASPVPEREAAAMAAYVPIAATMPVVGGAGASSSTGSSHSGSNSFGGLDVFNFFAAMTALLALCVVGWIRDRSRSGRSIFPSHGGRPG